MARGLFLRGTGQLPFGSQSRPVADLLLRLLGGKSHAHGAEMLTPTA